MSTPVGHFTYEDLAVIHAALKMALEVISNKDIVNNLPPELDKLNKHTLKMTKEAYNKVGKILDDLDKAAAIKPYIEEL